MKDHMKCLVPQRGTLLFHGALRINDNPAARFRMRQTRNIAASNNVAAIYGGFFFAEDGIVLMERRKDEPNFRAASLASARAFSRAR